VVHRLTVDNGRGRYGVMSSVGACLGSRSALTTWGTPLP